MVFIDPHVDLKFNIWVYKAFIMGSILRSLSLEKSWKASFQGPHGLAWRTYKCRTQFDNSVETSTSCERNRLLIVFLLLDFARRSAKVQKRTSRAEWRNRSSVHLHSVPLGFFPSNERLFSIYRCNNGASKENEILIITTQKYSFNQFLTAKWLRWKDVVCFSPCKDEQIIS